MSARPVLMVGGRMHGEVVQMKGHLVRVGGAPVLLVDDDEPTADGVEVEEYEVRWLGSSATVPMVQIEVACRREDLPRAPELLLHALIGRFRLEVSK